MSLLKLTYIAHGWHLETQNAPLFPNRIEAWQYGPVIPDVYREFRSQGVEVHNTANSIPQCAFDPADEELLNDVWSIYGHLPAFRLSDMTHVKGGPWDVTTMLKGTNYAEIPNELIRQHYAELRQRAEDATR